MMLNLILLGPLVYGTIEVDGVTRTKTYEELMDTENLQDDCDVRAINIVLQGLPPDVYSLVNHHEVAKKFGIELSYSCKEVKCYSKNVRANCTMSLIGLFRESFKDFDNGLHNEVNEVKTVFNQMEADVNSVLSKNVQEHADTLRGIVEQARKLNPSDPYLEYACKFTIRVQDLLAYVFETCPSSQIISKKLVAVTPMNKTRKVRFQEPKELTTTQKQAALQTKQTTNKTLLSSTRVIPSTSASGSQSKNNTRKNGITPGASSNKKNKIVEVHPRKVMSSSNKKNHVSMGNANSKHAVKEAYSKFV
ncbi:hypothetical protein Tco_1578084 [Tanacetum coccineum]